MKTIFFDKNEKGKTGIPIICGFAGKVLNDFNICEYFS
jgi:hypothetical protein